MNLVYKQDGILQMFPNEFCSRFKDSNVFLTHTIPLSRNISAEDNKWQNREVSESEV